MILRTLSILALAATLLPAASVFTDEATFQAALSPGFYTEAFPFSLANLPQNKPSGLGFSGNGFSYTISTGDGSDLYMSFAEYLATYNSNTALIINFTSGNVYGVGGVFFHTDVFDNTLFGSTLVLTLSDGTIETISPTGGSDYRGFLASAPITSLTISGAGLGLVNTLDNLTVGAAGTGAAAPADVPEPSTVALLLGASRRGRGAHGDTDGESGNESAHVHPFDGRARPRVKSRARFLRFDGGPVLEDVMRLAVPAPRPSACLAPSVSF